VVWLQSEGLRERVLPVEEGLAGHGEDEVEVDFERTGFAKEVEGLDGLHGSVFAAEGFEVLSQEGLHSQGDTGDAEFFVEVGGAGGEGGGVGFEGDFLDLRKVESLPESLEEFAKVGGREHGGGTATEVDGFERSKVLPC
jgi:hypothetical protein